MCYVSKVIPSSESRRALRSWIASNRLKFGVNNARHPLSLLGGLDVIADGTVAYMKLTRTISHDRPSNTIDPKAAVTF